MKDSSTKRLSPVSLPVEFAFLAKARLYLSDGMLMDIPLLALSSNGRTRDFESRYRGSNPCKAAHWIVAKW